MRENVSARNRMIKDSTLDWKPVFDQLRRATASGCGRGWPTCRCSCTRRWPAGKHVMFEGAQATLLDIDHGTYPFVTSSNASVGGVCTGLGVPPRAIGGVLGVAKAYTTRVGRGAAADRAVRRAGRSPARERPGVRRVDRRPRRCGWYDAVVVRYSARINGLDAHRADEAGRARRPARGAASAPATGRRRARSPSFRPICALLAEAEPVYETMPGWSAPTKGVTRFDELPREAQRYIRRLEEVSGVACAIISTGSDRSETIVREDSIVSGWLN